MVLRQVLVGTTATVGAATNPTNVPEGAIAFFNADTNALLTASDTFQDAPRIYVVQGVAAGKMPIVSSPLEGRYVTRYTGKAYAAPARMVANVAIAASGVTNSGVCTLKVVDLTPGYEPFDRMTKSISNAVTATPADSALKIAKEINADKSSVVWAEVLCSQTSTAIGGAETVTTINGSPILTSSGTSHGVVAGDFVRVGGTTVGTFGIYKVKSVSGAAITLDRPYYNPAQALGVSTSAVAASELDAAPDASDTATIKLTGKEYDTNFSVSLDDDLEVATLTYPTAFTPGFGRGVQIRKMEDYLKGNKGYHNRVWFPQFQDPGVFGVKATNYSVYTVSHKAVRADAAGMGAEVADAIELVIAIPTGAGTYKTEFEQTLNDYLSPNFEAVNI